jgi:hypothetical protein
MSQQEIVGTATANGISYNKALVNANGELLVDIGSAHQGSNINVKLEDLSSSLNADHANNSRALAVKQRVFYENQNLAGVNGLTVLGANNGTSIDMDLFRNLVIKIRATATTGQAGGLPNLRLFYSLEGGDFNLGELITLNEHPTLTGNYQGTIRVENVGFRYVQLISVATTGNPTAYVASFSRFN